MFQFLYLIYNEVLYRPLFNVLVFLTAASPKHDMGLSIILLTLAIRILIFPLTHRSLLTQLKLKELEPELNKIRETNKGKTEEQSRKMMELYKRHGINPLSGCFLLLLQLPILLALYYVFWKGISLPAENLYSFIHSPEFIQTKFLGAIELTSRSWVLAILAGISQFFQMKLSLPTKTAQPKSSSNFSQELSRAMTTQAVYIFPFLIFYVSLRFPAALALYWTASNIFATLHEAIVRRRAKKLYGSRGRENQRDN